MILRDQDPLPPSYKIATKTLPFILWQSLIESGIPSQTSSLLGDFHKSSLERLWYGYFGDYFPLFCSSGRQAPLLTSEVFSWESVGEPDYSSFKRPVFPQNRNHLGASKVTQTQRLSVEIEKCEYVIIWVQTPFVESFDQTLLKNVPRDHAGITSTWKLVCGIWMFSILRKTNNRKGKFQL